MTLETFNFIDDKKAALATVSQISQFLGGGVSPAYWTVSAKTVKSEDFGFLNTVSYHLPELEQGRWMKAWSERSGIDVDLSAFHNACGGDTRGCRWSCLRDSGRLGMEQQTTAGAVRGYIRSTQPDLAEAWAIHDLERVKREAERAGLRVCARNFGTHDGQVEDALPELVRRNPDVVFNDYTKLDLPLGWAEDNVYRCYSASELTRDGTIRYLTEQGYNVAVPFDVLRGRALPKQYLGVPVIDGDEHDLRFLDPRGVVVGLRAKVVGQGRDPHGFIRSVPVEVL